jgi:hypothetical protein
MGDEDPPRPLCGCRFTGVAAAGRAVTDDRRRYGRRVDEGAGLGFSQLEARLLSLTPDQQAAEPGALGDPEKADGLVAEDALPALGLEMLLPMRGDVRGEYHRLAARDGAGDHRGIRGRRRHYVL